MKHYQHNLDSWKLDNNCSIINGMYHDGNAYFTAYLSRTLEKMLSAVTDSLITWIKMVKMSRAWVKIVSVTRFIYDLVSLDTYLVSG